MTVDCTKVSYMSKASCPIMFSRAATLTSGASLEIYVSADDILVIGAEVPLLKRREQITTGIDSLY